MLPFGAGGRQQKPHVRLPVPPLAPSLAAELGYYIKSEWTTLHGDG